MKTKLTTGLILLLSLLCLSGIAQSSDVPTIYGVMRSSAEWGSSPKNGVYSFPAANPTAFTQVLEDGSMASISGTYHKDGNYYTITKTTTMGTRYTLHTYTTSPEWKRQGYGNMLVSATPLIAFDPVTEELYVITQSGLKNIVLNRLDRSGYFPTEIRIGEIPEAYTMSINVRGELFCISANGDLYKINLSNAEYELVGSTGLTPAGSSETQASTFDPLAPDKMYWSANLAGGVRGLYEVDTRSAYTKLVTTYTSSEVLTGIFIFPPTFIEGTPDIVKDLNLSFPTPNSLTGTVVFTVPSHTPNGVALEETVDISIVINDNTPVTATGLTPGGRYESSEITFTSGYQEITVTASNVSGLGNTASYSIWTGYDLPAAVTNLSLTENEAGEAVVTWEAPNGQHGGEVDTNSLKYKIIRYIETNSMVMEEAYTSTSYIDASAVDGEMGNYSYEVIPYTEAGEGPSALSNQLSLGSAFFVPYREHFVSRDNFNRWTINNIAGETVSYNWHYDLANGGQVSSLRRTSGIGADTDCDSWFFSPPIKLEEGRSYKISYKLTEYGETGHKGKVSVTMGTSADPATHTDVLGTYELNGNGIGNLYYESYLIKQTVEADGVYHIGFHDISGPGGYQLYLDDVFVEYMDLPAGVSDLTIIPAPQGQLKTFISFKTPTTTLEGTTLDEITIVEIYRNEMETPFWTSTGTVSPGEDFFLNDDEPINGFNTYRIVCSNTTGEGEVVEETSFVGVDVPASVSNVALLNQNGDALLVWSAPATGANGGYMDASSVKYKVVRNDNTVIAEDLTATTITDASIPREVQNYYFYRVTPYTDAGEGIVAASQALRFGDPLPAPFYESFAGASFTQKVWMAFEMSGPTLANWIAVQGASFPDAVPQDDDAGFVSFTSTRSSPGDSIRMVSPAIDIRSLSAPKLSFWMYHVEGNGVSKDRLWVQVSNNDGEYENLTAKAIEVGTGSADKEGWTHYEFSLEKYKGSNNITLGFIGVSDFGNNIHLDNISVCENYAYPAVDLLTGEVENGNTARLVWHVPSVAQGEALADIIGYNIYRNNERITETPLVETTYSEQLHENGTYIYKVTVVYEIGESEASNEVEMVIDSTGISSIDNLINIYAADKQIVIKGAIGCQAAVYSIEGRLLRQAVISENVHFIPVQTGMYIVKIGKDSTKVIVK